MLRSRERYEKKIIKENLFDETANANNFTVDEALSLLADLDLSKSQYKFLRTSLIRRNIDVLASYDILLQAKKRCYPPSSSIEITDTGAKIKLQDLLDHTIARILKIENVFNPTKRHLKLLTKWGWDGS